MKKNERIVNGKPVFEVETTNGIYVSMHKSKSIPSVVTPQKDEVTLFMKNPIDGTEIITTLDPVESHRFNYAIHELAGEEAYLIASSEVRFLRNKELIEGAIKSLQKRLSDLEMAQQINIDMGLISDNK